MRDKTWLDRFAADQTPEPSPNVIAAVETIAKFGGEARDSSLSPGYDSVSVDRQPEGIGRYLSIYFGAATGLYCSTKGGWYGLVETRAYIEEFKIAEQILSYYIDLISKGK